MTKYKRHSCWTCTPHGKLVKTILSLLIWNGFDYLLVVYICLLTLPLILCSTLCISFQVWPMSNDGPTTGTSRRGMERSNASGQDGFRPKSTIGRKATG